MIKGGVLLMAVAAAAMGACNTGPGNGVIIVGNSTFGANQPTSPYVATLDGGQPLSLAMEQGDLWNVTPGTYSVELTGVTSNCAIDFNNGGFAASNPINMTVARNDTVQAWFFINCH